MNPIEDLNMLSALISRVEMTTEIIEDENLTAGFKLALIQLKAARTGMIRSMRACGMIQQATQMVQ